ncbi:MAG TPA: transketolase, partial [Thermoplasmata archaeon]|nr:transketolase [Thermoplasmata archaeon]
GHPGLPLGAAPMAYVLWARHLRHNPKNPAWWDRDRFVLSAGHGSALLYALLHLFGYDLSIDDLRQFRQWGSRTPGHPERGHTPGVEATTGPLGQGFGMGVGLALAERHLAGRYNSSDHRTYGIVSDGDLMEGIGSEAASLAGHLGLGKLVYLYDDNHVTLEGPTETTFTEDVAARFRAYRWQVLSVPDGNDVAAIDRAIGEAKAEASRPTLVIVRTHIGYGSPRQDTYEAHGEPLGAAGTLATKRRLGWPTEPAFLVPDDVREYARGFPERGAALEREWRSRYDRFRAAQPALAAEFEGRLAGVLPTNWAADLPTFPAGTPVATRDAGGAAMNVLAASVPGLAGGSADLNPSTKTFLRAYGTFASDPPDGRNVHFGVREHAMGAIVNGLALHGGIRPFGATFLIFSDYARPAIRLAALMGLPSTFVFTHDSIALGEDGPTHQPVEQLSSMRLIPGLTVVRPADANETVALWAAIVPRPGPVAFALTRQKLPVLDPARFPTRSEGPGRGAYVLTDAGRPPPEVVLLATGSEVHLALAARERLEAVGRAVRVVSMPSWELFEEQPAAYRDAVLPPGLPTLAIEAGATAAWWRWVGRRGDVLGIDRFGASAPGPVVMEKLGLTVDAVVSRAERLLGVAAPAPGAAR